ncbi:prephenate dehydratase [Aliikangiella sp. IMCC44653]
MTDHKPNAQTSPNQVLTLEEIRHKISALDLSLLELIAQRRELSLAVAINKQSIQKPIRDQSREQELLDKLIQKGSQLGLDPYYVTRLYNTIIEDSLSVQRDYLQRQSNPQTMTDQATTVAVLGGVGAYSYLAAKKHFSHTEHKMLACDSFSQVIQAVIDEKTNFGVIPIENTTSGGITEVYDLLLPSTLSIIGEIKYPIKHCLVTQPNVRNSQIKTILAHPEASKQCNQNLPNLLDAPIKLVSSTAEALKLVADAPNGELAAIASEQSAKDFGLSILISNIANLKDNTTRFLVLAKNAHKVSAQLNCKTSIAFTTGQQPGALAEVLLAFRDAALPLTKLESRPIAEKPWEQMFYLDFEGNIESDQVQSALAHVAKSCRYLKVLGSYPSEDFSATKVSTNALTQAKLSTPEPFSQNESDAFAEQPKSNCVTGHGNQQTSPIDNYRLASRAHKAADTIIEVKGVSIGTAQLKVMAGPCAIESAAQILSCAQHAAEIGVSILHSEYSSSRDCPHNSQDQQELGADYLRQAGEKYNLPVITEVFNTQQLKAVAAKSDLIQIGAHNMQNFALLKAVAQINRPIVLKRSLTASIDDLLKAAEYILIQGNMQVILCESGQSPLENGTHNQLDFSAVAMLKSLSHLPVMVELSYAVDKPELMIPMALAAKAVGAHAILVKFHAEPNKAQNDAAQTLDFKAMTQLMHQLF